MKLQIARKGWQYIRLKCIFPRIYCKAAKGKKILNNKVIFIEANQKTLSSDLKLLYERFNEDDAWSVSLYILNRGFVSYFQYFKKTIRILKEIADARLVFLNGACEAVSGIEKRDGTFVVQLWHACGALKKFGWSTTGLPCGNSEIVYKKYPPYKNYNLVTVSGEAAIYPFEAAMQYASGSNIIQALGISRTDLFFDQKFIDNAFHHIKSVFPASKNRKIILYAPTFRGEAGRPLAPQMPDFYTFQRRLEEDYIIIIKHHQILRTRPQIPKDLENNFVFDATDLIPIEELICASDICITDYSSIIFEFSLFRKPIIFYAYDYEDYCKWNGFYYPYKETVPGPVVTSEKEMIDYIEAHETFDTDQIVAFSKRFMSACDGNSTDRILSYVLKHFHTE